MWSIALLINTCTWKEFKRNWEIICLVFLQLHLGEQYIKQEHQDILLDKIRKLKCDSDTFNAVKSSNYFESDNQTDLYDSNIYNFYDNEYDEDDDDHSEANHRFSKKKTKTV